MPVLASAPLKLLLFGEHAAVYGYPALGIPLPWKIAVSVAQAKSFTWDVEKKYQQQLNIFTSKIYQVFPELGCQPLCIRINAEAPIGIGFGSSGALCTAITRAIFRLMHRSANNQEVWQRAHLLEAHFHKKPSGVDTGLAVWERCGYFANQKMGLPSFKSLPSFSTPLIVGALPRSKNTGELISDLHNRLKENPSLRSSLSELGNISEEAQNSLEDPFLFGLLANQAQQHLSMLNLSTPELDFLLENAIGLGAIGGKLSGAGGGGAFYIVCSNDKNAIDIAHALEGLVEYSKKPVVIPVVFQN